MSWVTNTTVRWVSCQMRTISWRRRSRVLGSRAEKGSSISTMDGSTAKARAMATRWRSPPDNMAGNLCADVPSPTKSSKAWALAVCCLAAARPERSSTPISTLSITLRHGAKRGDWNTKATCSQAWLGGKPATSTLPPLACSKSPIRRRLVDLPQPEGPSKQTNSPWRTSKLRS